MRYQAGTLLFHQDGDPEVLRWLRDRHLPLARRRTRKLSEPRIREAVDWVLGKEKLALDGLRIQDAQRLLYFKHEERPILVHPQKLVLGRVAPDELNPGYSKLNVAFTLPPGSYATLVVKRLFHREGAPAEEPKGAEIRGAPGPIPRWPAACARGGASPKSRTRSPDATPTTAGGAPGARSATGTPWPERPGARLGLSGPGFRKKTGAKGGPGGAGPSATQTLESIGHGAARQGVLSVWNLETSTGAPPGCSRRAMAPAGLRREERERALLLSLHCPPAALGVMLAERTRRCPTEPRCCAARRGDRSAFETLVRSVQRPVYGLCLRLLRSTPRPPRWPRRRSCAPTRTCDRYDEGKPFDLWVMAIARNLCLDLLRRRTRVHTEDVDEMHEALPSGAAARRTASSPPRSSGSLESALSTLSADDREVLASTTCRSAPRRRLPR